MPWVPFGISGGVLVLSFCSFDISGGVLLFCPFDMSGGVPVGACMLLLLLLLLFTLVANV